MMGVRLGSDDGGPPSPPIDPNLAFEALRVEAASVIAHLLAELAIKDATISALSRPPPDGEQVR